MTSPERNKKARGSRNTRRRGLPVVHHLGRRAIARRLNPQILSIALERLADHLPRSVAME